ncbi:FAD-dependent oxidoreductase [Nocardiopsis xinjiangensis]
MGTGIIGASIGHHLALEGADVAFVDQAGSVAAGSTHASGGMVRAYDPDPVVAGLASAGLATYADPDAWPTGRAPLVRAGALSVARTESAPDLRETVCRMPGTQTLLLEAETEYMGVRLAGDVAVAEPGAGYVCPPRVAGGGSLRHGIELNTDAGTVSAGAVVTATGGWAPGWADTHRSLRTRSIQVSLVRRPDGTGSHATFVDLATGTYAKPLPGGVSLIGMPHPVWDVPPTRRTEPDAEHSGATLEALTHRLPWLEGAVTIDVVRSYDGYTADGELVRRSRDDRLWTVRPWNGTGVKVAPEVGRIVSEDLLCRM